MNTLIVYYSMSGNTDWAARALAGHLGAELLRLEPETAYPDKGFKKFFWGGKSAVMAETPALRPYSFDAAQYTQVILGFPVWAGTFAPPLRSFVKENAAALAGMRVSAFACQSGSGAEKALAKLEQLLGRPLHARMVLVDPMARPDAANDETLQSFCAACI